MLCEFMYSVYKHMTTTYEHVIYILEIYVWYTN
jgi:hypothetical protein